MNMRYTRQEDLLKLALAMQASAEGVSLDDISEMFEVSRRTSERMRDALQRAFPQIEERVEGQGRKRWRFPLGALGKIAEPTLEEIAATHRAAAIARREGDPATAEALERLTSKVKAAMHSGRRSSLEVDLEAQLMADGVAFRPGPREKISPEILTSLRHAILAGVMIEADHRARSSGKLSRNTRLGPIALLLGNGRQYLLAWSEWQSDLRLFSLAGFERISLANDVFERPEGFDLKAWMAESFGIWREEPVKVEWKFHPEVAQEAANYVFHPNQETEWLDDGSLLVRFCAGGQKEMDWYLYRWGDKVEAHYSEIFDQGIIYEED